MTIIALSPGVHQPPTNKARMNIDNEKKFRDIKNVKWNFKVLTCYCQMLFKNRI